MKILQNLLLFYFIILFGCNSKSKQVNHFTSLNDTIILVTDKIKGNGIFQGEACEMIFKDTTERYLYPVLFPKNIKDIKLAYQHIDFKPFKYKFLKNDTSDNLANFLKENYPPKIDTLNLPTLKENYICIMSGRIGQDTIFIVDENGNQDFRDDSVRHYKKIDWESTSGLIKCKHIIYNGKGRVKDSSWVDIGFVMNGEWFYSVPQHLVSNFSIDSQDYQVGIKDSQMDFCFDSPIMALLAENGIKKDTLLVSDLLSKGEYLKLKNSYYRFENVSNDGKYITLIREKDFDSKIGVQVGMKAPDFNCPSIDGNSASLSEYKGKYLLLINVTGCWSKVSSYECYKNITETYKGKIEFLGIDNSLEILRQNIKNLKLTGRFIIADNNQIIQKAFRPSYCSRTCFLINPEGRIIDKFEIFDWKSNLGKIF